MLDRTGTLPKVALVTGAARRLGRAIALRLADEGYAIALHCKSSLKEAEQTARDIETTGAAVAIIEADLADPAAVASIIPRALAALGPVTLLVNNASIFADDRVGGLAVSTWNRTFSINLRAPVMLAQDMALHLPEGMTGAVINIIDQKVGKLNPQCFTYTLTKAALWTATQTLAQALAPRIRVNAVSPGPVLPNEHDGEAGFVTESALTPLGEPVDPADIAEAVAYLAHASKITGQMVSVDSGQHIAWRTPDVVGDLAGFRRPTDAKSASAPIVKKGVDQLRRRRVDTGRSHEVIKRGA
jgi:NAD(P)-dependent dehydrogenase (short-subunit alcohol dehydrogenase family)